MDYGNAFILEQRSRPNARQLQQLRRLQSAGTEQHFSAAVCLLILLMLPITHTNGAPALHEQPRRERVTFNSQIRPAARRLEVALGSAPTQAAPGVELVVTCALLAGTVKVFIARHAKLVSAGNERFDQRVFGANVRDRQRPLVTVKRIGTTLVALRLYEIGQQIVIAPAVVAQRLPVVIIFALTTDIN